MQVEKFAVLSANKTHFMVFEINYSTSVLNDRLNITGNNEFIFTMANNERIVSGRSYKEQIAKALQEQVV